MRVRWSYWVLLGCLILLQYPLWFSKGGWIHVWDNQNRLTEARQNNQRVEQKNVEMAADIEDLKQGTDAIEERARFELGLVKEGETYYRIWGEGEDRSALTTSGFSPEVVKR